MDEQSRSPAVPVALVGLPPGAAGGDGVWFGVLGPLLVRDGDALVEVPRGRLRVLLAALLLRAGRPVMAGELAEVVWDGAPPRGAEVTLRSHVLRLRRALGPRAGARLVTGHRGYLLAAGAGEVDVLRFRELCRDGGAALRDGAWAGADGLLGEALALWRGDALEDVPSEQMLREEAPGLEGLRLQAEEWRADAALRLGRHDELVAGLQALAAAHPLRERFHAQLMLALYRCGRQADALAAYQDVRRQLVEEVGSEPGPELRLLHKQVLTGDPALDLESTPPAGAAVPAFPYRGLSAFGEKDAGLFFGREDATARVLEAMSSCLAGPGLVIVSGVSGAGKSSLLHAGVLPRLREAGLAAAPEAASWPCLAFTPGRSPLTELAAQVAPLAGLDPATLRRQLAADPASLALAARQAALPAGQAGAGHQRVVLVVDQYEQLFTLCPSQPERQAFVAALHAAATAGPAGQPAAALVVLAVRADFEARLADFPQLPQAVQDRYLLTAMTRRQLRLAITRPAAIAGSCVEEDLVQVLLEEAATRTAGPSATGAGTLPLLSHALDQAWRAREGHLLSLADYERAGGIEAAVARSAQDAYDHLTLAQQVAARQVFLQLAAVGPDGTDTAVPAATATLMASTPAAAPGDVETVLDAFTARRLLTLADGTVEISHEALLTAWPLLRDTWLNETRADRAILAGLRASATSWAEHERDPAYLYTGSLLEAAAAAVARADADPARHQPLAPGDRAFLAASSHARRRRARHLYGLLVILNALILALAAATAVALSQRATANAERDQAIENQLVAEADLLSPTNPSLAAQLLLTAYHMGPQNRDLAWRLISTESQALSASHDVPGYFVDSVGFSPHGMILVADSGDKVTLWSVNASAGIRELSQPLTTTDHGHVGSLGSVAFSPDGTTLAIGDSGGVVTLWDVANPARPSQLSQLATHSQGIAPSVAFSPHGTTLATGGTGNAIALWDVANPARPSQLSHLIGYRLGRVPAVAFSPDGTTLAAGGTGGLADTVTLWDVVNPVRPSQLSQLTTPNGGPVDSVAFSPDGTTLAAGDDADGMVTLWDVVNPAQPSQLSHLTGNGPVESVAFSPDGTTLAAGGFAGPVRLWDVANPARPSQLSHLILSTGSSWVAFSPDGTTLASLEARTITLSRLPSTALRARTTGHPSTESLVALSPDGIILAVGHSDPDVRNSADTVTLWDVANPAQPHQLSHLTIHNTGTVSSVAFSPHGTILAVGNSVPAVRNSADTVTLWDVANRARPRQLSQLSQLSDPFVVPLAAFSPDGTTLAVAVGGTVRLWNVASAARPRQLSHLTISNGNRQVDSVAFSPDGSTLAAGVAGGATLWNVANPAQPRQLSHLSLFGGVASVYSVAFSPDGSTLVTGDDGGTVTLWNVASAARPRQLSHLTISNGNRQVDSVAFSPDGTLAVGDGNGTVTLWDASSPAQLRQLGQPLSIGSGNQVNYSVAFSPDGTLAAGGSGAVQVWKDASYAIRRICDLTAGTLTPQQWRQYIPQLPYDPPCSSYR